MMAAEETISSVVRIINHQQRFSDRDNCIYNMAHLRMLIRANRRGGGRTVNSNSHGFCQDVSICTNKGRDSAQRVELEVFKILDRGSGFDKFNVQIVGFCNSQQDGCPRIFLGQPSQPRKGCNNRLCSE